MIDLILAFDDNDSELGEYFYDGSQDILSTVSNISSVTLHSIDGLNCTKENISSKALSLNHKAFIFVGLCHGNKKELVANEVFVDFNNSFHFVNSLFYSVACSSAHSLGKKVIADSGKCYIGYKNDSLATYDSFNNIYIECENFALNEFLKTEKTIGQTFNEMKVFFEDKIIQLYHQDEILVAMELENNLDSLSINGDQNLTRKDFM